MTSDVEKQVAELPEKTKKPKKEPNALVAQRIEITPDLIKLRIVPQGWDLPDFEPGQYATLGLAGSTARCPLAEPEDAPPKDRDKMIMRAYSVASSSVESQYLEFYVGLVRFGALSPRLFSLQAGDKLWISTRFKGMFTLADIPEEQNAVLIATGTGVAPYMSMLRTEAASGLKRRFAVIHGADRSYDLGYHSELSTLDMVCPTFSYLPILAKPEAEPVPWSGQKGFAQDLWKSGVIENAWGIRPTPENTHVFLCGNPLMIQNMTAALEPEGFVTHTKKQPGQIHTEQYFVKL